MTDLATLKDRLDRLRRARASGLRAVGHGETRVDYKSDAEMAAAIADLERQIAEVEGTPRRRVRYLYQSSKGL